MAKYPGLGTDLKLSDGNFQIGVNGDVQLCEGGECLVQGVAHRLMTPREGLFYDLAFGLRIFDYLHGDGTELEQLDFCQAVRDQLKLEPRIRYGTGACEVLEWTSKQVWFQVTFVHIEETNASNLVLGANLDNMALVVGGVNV